MKQHFIAATLSLLATLPFSLALAQAGSCPEQWQNSCEMIPYKNESLRAGYIKENTLVEFRGNILYLQGLGDSMINHEELFSNLSDLGFRVISFDYMGQGGSTGKMNNTRMQDIVDLGQEVYARYARATTSQIKPIIIGWSTGGLAAYMSAQQNKAQAIVAIAPGIVPRFFVGENNLLQGKALAITKDSLTSDLYSSLEEDPHLDPIKPTSALHVPLFGADLIKSSYFSRGKSLTSSVPALILMGGQDKYVNTEKMLEVLKEKAPQAKLQLYPDARHEIHNERAEIRNLAFRDIFQFVLSLGL